MSLTRKMLAELLGTFWLVFAGCGSAVLGGADHRWSAGRIRLEVAGRVRNRRCGSVTRGGRVT